MKLQSGNIPFLIYLYRDPIGDKEPDGGNRKHNVILHAENICSNSSGNWTAFGNCGKGVFPNWYKVMEKLDALAYKAVNILF